MELFGILLSVPTAFVAATVYSFTIQRLAARLAWLVKPALITSVIVLVTLVLEWCLLGTMGAVRSREVIGPQFYAIHSAVFFLSLPALANILILGRPGSGVRR